MHENFASDAAFYNGRRFKIGWSHSNKLQILSTANKCKDTKKVFGINQIFSILNGRENHDTSKPVIKQIKVSTLKSIIAKTFEKSILSHLQCQLNHSKKEITENSDCPYYTVNGGTTALEEHFELANNNSKSNDFDKFCATVWSLCVALWGDQEDLQEIREDDHIAIMLRRELFSKWLEEVLAEKDLLQKNVNRNDYLDHLWKLLTAHKVNEACDLAFEQNDVNLSLLLAQAGSSKIVRALVSMQLESWRITEADKFIAVDRLKAMMLVGAMSTFESTNGVINIYEKLDWLKSLAVSNL